MSWVALGSKPLPISFDFEDQATLRPVGRYAKDFKALLGVTLRQTVPFTYDAWEHVPRDTRTAIYPQLQTYFDIGRYIGPRGISDSFERGINKLCASLYSAAKYHFKNKHFTKLGGYDNADNIREIVPSNMDAQAWNDLIDYYIRDDNKRKSLANSNNRGNHRYPTYQGSKSFVEIRHDRRESDGTYPSLIELFKEKRTKTLPNGTTQISDLAMQHYERMKKLLNDQQGVENPMTEDQILDEVLGKRRGFKRGRGHVISGYNSSSSSPGAGTSTPPGRVYTQDDVDALLKATYKRTKRETDFLTKKVDIMAKAMSDHGFDIVWEEPDEEDTSSDSD